MPIDSQKLDLPSKPGVYLFRRNDERVMYVGKATNLRSRVRSYFSENPDRIMIPKLIQNSEKIDCIITQTPTEALILERELIRKHKPKYNSRLKDDKSYPFISLTKEEFPRIIYTRSPAKNDLSWGPFPDAGAAKRVIQLVRRQFGIRDRDCNGKNGCLASHIGLCRGPCIDPEGYPQRVAAVTKVFDGDGRILIQKLQIDMDMASKSMYYEKAAEIRDMIRTIQTTISQQIIHSRFYQDCDAVGFAFTGDSGSVTILHTKDGIIQGQVDYPVIHSGDISESISCVLTEHYAKRKPPKTLLIPIKLDEDLTNFLNERRGGVIKIKVPKRGELVKLRNMADKNAKMNVLRNQKNRTGSLEQNAANECSKLLGMAALNHIVCFDMAQMLGEERVGASVVFRNGRSSNKEYRKYRVKTDAKDDLRMMSEVILRWMKRQDEWPDLLLLDGGKTHLTTIVKVLENNGVKNMFVIAALAKKEETLHRTDKEPIVLTREGRLLVHARDEAHRFVNKYHRKRRGKKTLLDPLEEIEGLGAKKIQSLLRHFGGRQGINHAKVNDLMAVPGIGKFMANRIFEHINE
ncbi:MAG: excinuclease ABC subunit UvrC [Euryarchaeota archaeon]|jgi:excinuclease ABC subunit C|nr:excinuclease ABC subunit UvrC [Euryarchaeota archaeon]MBT6684206.1 excinuclease ABC subunit UvrC [Euryarchaeota archaeon]MBT6874094.1 excinuclease ABC subunit UvrC [Euryarchaeota archaeon]MBT7413064.1 excinuclease ABC subunit UvrC [Euryarchaeota archaeon]